MARRGGYSVPKPWGLGYDKFRKKKTSKEVIETEISQVKSTGLNCYKYVFFSRAGFTAMETEDINFINLDQIF